MVRFPQFPFYLKRFNKPIEETNLKDRYKSRKIKPKSRKLQPPNWQSRHASDDAVQVLMWPHKLGGVVGLFTAAKDTHQGCKPHKWCLPNWAAISDCNFYPEDAIKCSSNCSSRSPVSGTQWILLLTQCYWHTLSRTSHRKMSEKLDSLSDSGSVSKMGCCAERKETTKRHSDSIYTYMWIHW